jgi:hypothetical protein
MAKKAAGRRSSNKRTTVKPKGDTRYVKRTRGGRFKESDDQGKSLRSDRRTKSRKTVKSGYGDQGDQKRGR